MPGTEVTITVGSTGSEEAITATAGLEEAIPGSDVENLADAGPLDIGRLDVDLYGREETIVAQ